MKKFTILLLICIMTVGVAFTQGIRDDQQAGNTPRAERQQRLEQHGIELIIINGELKLVNGFVAVQSGENTFIVPMLTRYIGFINGLQEGNTVSVEGFAMRNFLHPQKLTIEGREYNFLSGMFAQGFPQQRQFNTPQRPNQPVPQRQFNVPNNRERSRNFSCCCTPVRRTERREKDGERERNRGERPRRQQSSVDVTEEISTT